MSRHNGYLLLSDTEALARYEQRLPPLPEPSAVALARALAANPGWPDDSRPLLIAHHAGPQPRLLVLGRFDAAGEAWLRCQTHALHQACTHLRYVGYPQVERDCERLALILREHLGGDLSRAKLMAIPRGGFVVLGLLAALLHLEREQIVPPYPGDRPLVVVDDCALSGLRFSQLLQARGSGRIVFAPLYSPPGLRAEIETREPNVQVVTAADIADIADIAGKPLAEPPRTGYWSGTTEALAFPWNEPDRAVWNPAAGRWETAWRIVPPELCLKNRPLPGVEPIPVQVHPPL